MFYWARVEVDVTIGSLEEIPEGWYALADSAQVTRDRVVAVELAGERLVAWRDGAGVARVQSAYCPHLGAALDRGAEVVGGELRCPFHGFRFDGEGRCVATGYDTRPPGAARLRTLPSVERHGCVLVWWSSVRAEPAWELPVVDEAGWSAFRFHTWELDGHPQETTENSVDVGHFRWVHGYEEVESLGPTETDGPHLRARYTFIRRFPQGWPGALVSRQRIEVFVSGLGYSRVEVALSVGGLRMRLLVLPQPLAVRRICLRVGLSVLDPKRTDGASAWARWMPPWFVAQVVGRAALGVYRREVAADFEIWRHKAYVSPPVLAAGDGPIGRYRQWARQFYPSAA